MRLIAALIALLAPSVSLAQQPPVVPICSLALVSAKPLDQDKMVVKIETLCNTGGSRMVVVAKHGNLPQRTLEISDGPTHHVSTFVLPADLMNNHDVLLIPSNKPTE